MLNIFVDAIDLLWGLYDCVWIEYLVYLKINCL